AENFSLPLWPGIRPMFRSASSTSCAPPSPLASNAPASFTAPSLAAARRRRNRRVLVVGRLSAPLRQRHPAQVLAAPDPDDPARRRDQARRLHRLRLLQPLVALL